jgi:hypothetical protein
LYIHKSVEKLGNISKKIGKKDLPRDFIYSIQGAKAYFEYSISPDIGLASFALMPFVVIIDVKTLIAGGEFVKIGLA